MCVGVAALILILSVFNGLESLVISLYDTFNPDLKVTPKEGKIFIPPAEQIAELKKVDGVTEVAFVLEELAVLRYEDKITNVRLKGVDDNFINVAGIADTAMIRGDFSLKDNGVYQAVVGSGVERTLRIDVYNEFESLEILMPKRKGKLTSSNPEKAFKLKGVYPVGTFSIQEEFDREFVFVSLELMQELLEYDNGEISHLEIKTDPETSHDKVKKSAAAILGSQFDVKTQYEQDAFLYKVMKTEKLAVFLILTLILGVAAFNIIGSLSMLVIEKTKDIAILKSMGADKSLIRNIFLLEGFLLSFLGGAFGMLIAFSACFIQQKFKLLSINGDSLLIDAYPVEMRLGDFILVLFTIILISILAAWFPAQRASNQSSFLKGA